MTTIDTPTARSGPRRRPPTRARRALVTIASLTLAAALVAVAVLAIRAAADAAPRPPAAALPAVAAIVPTRRDAHEVVRAYAARVEPAREARLSFETGGTLVEVAVEEGERVAEGTVLARLDTRRLVAERERLAAARAALDSDAELASLALARQRTLEGRGFAADEALDEARLSVTRTESRIAEADAALALVDVELDKAVLRAPFDALVGERRLDPGATVSPGTPVVHVLETGATRLRVGLPPERAATLERTRSYDFVAGSRTIPARLVALRGDVDVRTRTVSALFEPVEGAGTTLFFGELLELALTERVPGTVFDVPLAALSEDERGLWSVLEVVAEPDAGDGRPAADTDSRVDNGSPVSDADAGGERPVAVANAGPSRSEVARLRRVAVEIVHLTGTRAFVSAAFGDGARIVADGSHRVVAGERVRVVVPGNGDGTDDGARDGADDGSAARRLAAGERGS